MNQPNDVISIDQMDAAFMSQGDKPLKYTVSVTGADGEKYVADMTNLRDPMEYISFETSVDGLLYL